MFIGFEVMTVTALFLIRRISQDGDGREESKDNTSHKLTSICTSVSGLNTPFCDHHDVDDDKRWVVYLNGEPELVFFLFNARSSLVQCIQQHYLLSTCTPSAMT